MLKWDNIMHVKHNVCIRYIIIIIYKVWHCLQACVAEIQSERHIRIRCTDTVITHT